MRATATRRKNKIQNTNEFNAVNSIAHDFLYAHDNKIWYLVEGKKKRALLLRK